jgi:lactate permease
VLGAQTAGGAVGSVIAPTKIVVGAATAGLEGREGEVIRKLARYVLPLLLLLSAVLWLATGSL